MSTPNFDTNTWYNVHIGNDTDSSLQGTVLYGPPNATGALKGTRGAVFMKTTDASSRLQKWQIFPLTINNTIVYAMRSQESSAKSFMATSLSDTEVEEGSTRPDMVRGDVSDRSVYWSFQKWGSEDSFYLTNAANGTKYHLNVNASTTLMNMSPNMSATITQQWSFEPIGKINDKVWSTVNLPGVTVTASPTSSSSSASASASPTGPASASTTPSSTPSPSSSSSASASSPSPAPSNGLSTGAKAGIGAGIGAFALLALVFLGLFLYRRKRSAKSREPPRYEVANTEHIPHGAEYYKMRHDDVTTQHELPSAAEKYEMSGRNSKYAMPPVEAPASEDHIAELPASTVGEKRR